jgi:hypothetical protein
LHFQNEEKRRAANELVVANELVLQDIEKEKQTAN